MSHARHGLSPVVKSFRECLRNSPATASTRIRKEVAQNALRSGKDQPKTRKLVNTKVNSSNSTLFIQDVNSVRPQRTQACFAPRQSHLPPDMKTLTRGSFPLRFPAHPAREIHGMALVMSRPVMMDTWPSSQLPKDSSMESLSHVEGDSQECNVDIVDCLGTSIVTALSDSEDWSVSEPFDAATVYDHSQNRVKTLSSIGQNRVTFCPGRATIRKELEGICRTTDANLDKHVFRDRSSVFLGEQTDDHSDCTELCDQDNHRFKTVSLLKGHVSEWFTGKSREQGFKALPAIVEEDEVSDDDFEQQEDIFQNEDLAILLR